jgi:hypothetical protein
MKPKSSPIISRVRLGLAVLLAHAGLASAATTVTFQVDMSNNPLTTGETVVASGTFDGWTALGSVLTNNPNAANTNLFTGTYTDSSDANGTGMIWQYRIIKNGGVVSYSSQADGDNYCVTLPTNGGTLVLPIQFWDDDGTATTNDVTFQVDMAEQIHLGNFNPSYPVYAYGYFEGWNNSFPLTNNPALNVTNAQGYITSFPYQGTYTVTNSPGGAEEYKFVYNAGNGPVYEQVTTGDRDSSPSENRAFLNQPETLPLVSFGDVPFSNTVTNNVTFIVDMSVQELYNAFNPATQTVQIVGDYNNFAGGTALTNTNAANTNLYYFTYQYVGAAGSLVYYKYQIDPGGNYESPAASNLIGNNRYYMLAATSGNFNAGPVYYSDQGPPPAADLVASSNCMVTFTVDMTPAVNGTVDSNLNFTVGFDTVELNGLNNGNVDSFWTWSSSAYPPQYQMTNIPGGNLYTITLPVNQGQPLNIQYDYGIDGEPNEPNGNHFHYIRSQPNYSMPTDVFGSPAPAEQSFGNLTVSNVNNQVYLNWLGRTGVALATNSDLSSQSNWMRLPATDGTNLVVTQGPGTMPPVGYATTNYTVTPGSAVFYKLVGPQ